MAITIKTNNHSRHLLYWDDLTVKEQVEHDWIAPEEWDDFTFFRYKGYCYCTSNFMRLDSNTAFYALGGWEGYHGDSFFSGTLIKYTPCGDGVIVAAYYS